MKRKFVRVKISPELVEWWLKSTGDDCVFRHIEGVPPDSEMVGLRYDFDGGIYHAIFYHESFKHVPEGEKIPEMRVKVTTYYV